MSPAPYIGNPKDPIRNTPVQDWGPLPSVQVDDRVQASVAAAAEVLVEDDGFPRARLVAAGVSEDVVADLAAAWPDMTEEDRRWEADGIAKLDDEGLVKWGESLEVPDGTIPEVEDWARTHPLAYLAMRVALAHEKAKDKPRVTLVEHFTVALTPGETP